MLSLHKTEQYKYISNRRLTCILNGD